MDIEAKMHFSYDLEAGLTEEERKANEVLNRMRKQFKNDKFNIIIHDYFNNFVSFTLFVMCLVIIERFKSIQLTRLDA